jgi:hypothetical protein
MVITAAEHGGGTGGQTGVVACREYYVEPCPLEKRVDQMAYPVFQAAGWPIGSGMVESANKLVVEDRLKGAGMIWLRSSPNIIART